jgi:ribosome recycling factor
MEDINLILEMAEDHMSKAIKHLDKELLKVRAGRANPAMLEGVRVDYYGTPTPLSQVANVNTPDARTVTVQPWEKKMIPEIEKAIIGANLGFNPSNNGDYVIINIPPLTEERRRDLVKQAKGEAEDARVGIRSARQEANHELKRLKDISEDIVKDAEADVQKLTDKYIARVEEILTKKEAEIMQV